MTFTATASDADVPANTLTFSLVGAPTGASITSGGVFTWTPTETQGPGGYTFDIVVADGVGGSDSETITVTVNETNTAPVAADDFHLMQEDTSAVIEVTSNDNDQDGDSLRIVSVSQPSFGAAVVNGSGTVFYMPPVDFWGTTSFTYTVSDGAGGEATATVFIEVAPVNDAPIAQRDEYRLPNYLTVNLDVLDNDRDPDGDHIRVILGSLPASGYAESNGSDIVYAPENGFVGTVTFSYFVVDPSGARNEGIVTVIISADVLMGAEHLAEGLGVATVPFDAPSPIFDATELSLVNVEAVTLLADVFFQTAEALRVPLSFLGLTALILLGLAAATRLPLLLFGTRRFYWAVVLRSREQGLPVYANPAGTKLIYIFDPTTTGIVSTGKPRWVDEILWLRVETPNGDGWVEREYLTEQVDLETFMNDPRPVKLVNQLAEKLRNGRDLNSLISQRGPVIALTGPPARTPSSGKTGLLGESSFRHIGGALNAKDDFLVAVKGPFLEAHDATEIVTAETPHSPMSLIPTECWNFPYLSLGVGGDVQPWLVFFEYRRGKAWIAGLGIDE